MKVKVKKPLVTTLSRAPSSSKKIEDQSHLRKPIETSIFGLRQVISLLDTSTQEVQDYISYECDILYECRICRTIFRSLANFILHKRNYCTEKFANVDNVRTKTSIKSNKDVISEEIETITLSDSSRSPSPEIQLRSQVDLKSHDDGQVENKPEKGIAHVIDKLVDRNKVKELAQKALKEDLSRVVKKKPEKRVENSNVKLESIPTNEAAVFQTMFKSLVEESKPEFMKSEVMELHGLFDSDEAVLGADGKICTFKTNKVNEKPNIPKNTLVCTECDLKFATKKTLAYHIKYKHNMSQIVYPCPVCKDTFANVWCVYRHLLKIHRKTSSQIRKLRETIHNSAVLKRDLQSTSLMKKDKKSNEKPSDDENQWLKNLEGDNDIQMCGGCGKRFERKAALYSHSQMCLKRAAVCNTIKEKNKKGQEEKDKVKAVKTDRQPVTEMISGSKKRKPQIVISYKHVASKKSPDESNTPKTNDDDLAGTSTPRAELNSPGTNDRDLSGPSTATTSKPDERIAAETSTATTSNNDERIAAETQPQNTEDVTKVNDVVLRNCDNNEVVITKIAKNTYREETDAGKNDSFDTDDDPVYQQNDSYIPLDNLDKESMMSILGISMNPVTIYHCTSPNNKSPPEEEDSEEEFNENSRNFDRKNEVISKSSEEKNEETIQGELENSSDDTGDHTSLERAIFETVNIENCKSLDGTSAGASNSEDPFFGFAHSSIESKEYFGGESSESLNKQTSHEPVPHSFDLVLMKDSAVDERVNKSADKNSIQSASNSMSDISSGICENNLDETSNDEILTGIKFIAEPASARNKNFCGMGITEDVPSLEIDPLLIEGDEGIDTFAEIPSDYQKIIIYSNKTVDETTVAEQKETNLKSTFHISSIDAEMEVKKLESSDFIKINNDYIDYIQNEENVRHESEKSVQSVTDFEGKYDMEQDESIIIKLPKTSSKRRHTYSLGAGKSPEMKKLRHSNDFDEDNHTERFSVLASPFLDQSGLKCTPCDKQYPTNSHLLEHMALHFSWFRFQCSHCTFMSFSKANCEKHATEVHNASSKSLSNIVLSIPNWKTMLISHDFLPIEDKQSSLNNDTISSQTNEVIEAIDMNNKLFPQRKTDGFQEIQNANDTLEIDTVNTKDNYKIDISDMTDSFLLFKDDELYSQNVTDKPEAMNPDGESILEILCSEEESNETSSFKHKRENDLEVLKSEGPNHESNAPGLSEKFSDSLPEDKTETKKIDENLVQKEKVKNEKKLQNTPRPIRKRIKSSKTSQSDFLYDLDNAVKLKSCVIRKKTSPTAKLQKSPKKPSAHGTFDLKPCPVRMKQSDASVILDSQKGDKKTN